MAHALLPEVSGGNDFDVLDEALRQARRLSCFTADRAPHAQQPAVLRDPGQSTRMKEFVPPRQTRCRA